MLVGSNPTVKYFLVSLTEPQTSMSPQVKDKEVGSVRKSVGEQGTAPLLCAAQGHPPPIFRYYALNCSIPQLGSAVYLNDSFSHHLYISCPSFATY
jgi:hypothetical protein